MFHRKCRGCLRFWGSPLDFVWKLCLLLFCFLLLLCYIYIYYIIIYYNIIIIIVIINNIDE